MNDYLYHHGIRGMKWGVRRFQNEDGSYTAEGKERYRHRDEQMSKIRQDANICRQRAETFSLLAKRISSAYYDHNDDGAMDKVVRDVYSDPSAADSFMDKYRNSDENRKASIVSSVYIQLLNRARQERANEYGLNAVADTMSNWGDEELFSSDRRRRKDSERAIENGNQAGSEALKRIGRMTATELMIDMDMDNEFTRNYNELFGRK